MRTNIRIALVRLITIGALIFASPAQANEFIGRVVGITDGDTLTLLVNGRETYKIRLAGIDAPEKKQPFGQKSKDKLSELSYNREAQVQWQKTDRYGRIIGKVFVANKDVNLAMVATGYAWHYKAYENEQSPLDRSQYDAAERQARQIKLGLWNDAAPVPPWLYRKTKKHSAGEPSHTERGF